MTRPADDACAAVATDFRALRERARAIGMSISRKRAETLLCTFDDSLSGELARLAVRRRLRRERPDLSPERIEQAVSEVLEP